MVFFFGKKEIFSFADLREEEDIRVLYTVTPILCWSRTNKDEVIVSCFQCLGPTYPLTPTRGDIEYRALQQFHRLSSGSVPVPYFYDKDSNLSKNDTRCFHFLLASTYFRLTWWWLYTWTAKTVSLSKSSYGVLCFLFKHHEHSVYSFQYACKIWKSTRIFATSL